MKSAPIVARTSPQISAETHIPPGADDAIDGEFSAVCRAIWGFTLDDFTDDDLSPQDHAWLDQLTQECAFDFAADQVIRPQGLRPRGLCR
jgi:hypothetical protein